MRWSRGACDHHFSLWRHSSLALQGTVCSEMGKTHGRSTVRRSGRFCLLSCLCTVRNDTGQRWEASWLFRKLGQADSPHCPRSPVCKAEGTVPLADLGARRPLGSEQRGWQGSGIHICLCSSESLTPGGPGWKEGRLPEAPWTSEPRLVSVPFHTGRHDAASQAPGGTRVRIRPHPSLGWDWPPWPRLWPVLCRVVEPGWLLPFHGLVIPERGVEGSPI